MSEELFAVLFCRQYFAQLPQGALQFLEAFYKVISIYFLQPPPSYFYEYMLFFNKSKSHLSAEIFQIFTNILMKGFLQ